MLSMGPLARRRASQCRIDRLSRLKLVVVRPGLILVCNVVSRRPRLRVRWFSDLTPLPDRRHLRRRSLSRVPTDVSLAPVLTWCVRLRRVHRTVKL